LSIVGITVENQVAARARVTRNLRSKSHAVTIYAEILYCDETFSIYLEIRLSIYTQAKIL
jgi:hypothetical protein